MKASDAARTVSEASNRESTSLIKIHSGIEARLHSMPVVFCFRFMVRFFGWGITGWNKIRKYP